MKYFLILLLFSCKPAINREQIKAELKAHQDTLAGNQTIHDAIRSTDHLVKLKPSDMAYEASYQQRQARRRQVIDSLQNLLQ